MSFSTISSTQTPYLLVAIEGNIGVGKTTLLNALEQHYQNHPNVMILREPVEQWEQVKDEQGISILSHFYRDPNKYAFSFQVLVFQSLQTLLQNTIEIPFRENPRDESMDMTMIQKEPNQRIIFCERSLLSSRFIFERMLYEQQLINPIEHHIYEMLYDIPMDHLFPDVVIYLECNPQICMERILQRNRQGETNITLEYLTTCDHYYKQHLKKLVKQDKMEQKTTSILILDVSNHVYDDTENSATNWIYQIETFCEINLK